MDQEARVQCGSCGNTFPVDLSYFVPHKSRRDRAGQAWCTNCHHLTRCTAENVIYQDLPQESPEAR